MAAEDRICDRPGAKRLRRAEGHLRATIAMLAAARSPTEIAQQIRAA
jgi:DNA-binding FrmR family transcriptional regulator